MARNWRKGKLLKAAVGGTVVGLTGGATALAAAGAVSSDPTPVDAPSDDSVSLDLEDGTVQVTVDDEIVDDLDADDQGADSADDSVTGDTPPAAETVDSVASVDSVDADEASVDADEASVDADDQGEDADDQGEDADDQGDDESVDNDDESGD